MPRRPTTDANLAELLRAARAELDATHGHGTALATTARRLATSTRQLERAFADAGGTSFRAELTAARLRHAADLLFESHLTVGEVAQAVGYRQPAHFAKAFRHAYGAAPATWRREQQRQRPDELRARRARLREEQRGARERAEQERWQRWAVERIEEAAASGRSAWPTSLPPPDK